MQQGGGRHVKKSSSTKRERKHLKREKKGDTWNCTALIRWQMLFWMMAILPKRERKAEGGRWRRGSCTLLYGGHRGKLQSSVTHLEYLTHCERHYFSPNIKRFFFWDLTAMAILTETARDLASISVVKQEWRLRPFEGDDDESRTQSCFMRRESEKCWTIMCVCRGKRS